MILKVLFLFIVYEMQFAKRVGIFSLALLGGTLLLSYVDYLYASLVQTYWVYNSINQTREVASEEEYLTHPGQVSFGTKFDFFSDFSFQKFLDSSHTLSDFYVPSDLQSIHSDFLFNSASKYQLRNEAAEKFSHMAWEFSHAFDFKARLSITSSYRSSAFQRKLASSCSITRCAEAGTSEHEAGLAIDLGVNGGNILAAGEKYYQWLADNAHLHGFHQSYQKGIEIDGKIVEPWHWRYVGVELATLLYQNQQSFTEYFYSHSDL
ncbi:MAG: M15 family metallopeptidase [Candidatus Absconditabacteria bacterium]|nr:M15 family metallopeptidase [Candidatus Absconditabacteria bacterium]MDD3868294.1 M15 family metallopeptidase [Candidatus Absconditabacteria bacterium]MDD4714017.1 M15 family metallopeptidase [Candidatus Absconditabacteria bacterium]